ncbi:MAG TPA: aminotransferase class I/II-fold pyridoxal phosphate-dependent enzyme [Thermoplasmata archaeon]|nr:aminotransferase class I/II-fold pyridoxal phosphate-dependent enzyme [Thermoplasmata archaeon]
MRFPLVDWIHAHPGCRHDLAQSGLFGVVRRAPVSPAEVRRADPARLRAELADRQGVPAERLFVTHGATEGNGLVLNFVRRRAGGRTPVARVRYPEYPPLYDGARAAGFRVVDDERPAELAILSNPRNPEGNDLGARRIVDWADGARQLLIDETFRGFGDRPSLARLPRDDVWVTGTFTKYFAGDDLRVGFVVAPERARAGFERFVGLFTELLAPVAVAGALSALRHEREFGRPVARLMAANRAALARAFPGVEPPVAPVWFDRPGPAETTALAERLAAASILVCPGRLFGDPTGVRLCLTRRTFPRDLAAYVARRGDPPPGPTGRGTSRRARPRPAGSARGRAARS